MSSKSAYRFSVENSIYLGHAAAGKGLGRALLEALIEACEQAGIREIVAVISDKGAEASVALHEKLGFVEVGPDGPRRLQVRALARHDLPAEAPQAREEEGPLPALISGPRGAAVDPSSRTAPRR